MDELARNNFEKHPDKIKLISSFSVVEFCNTTTIKLDKDTEKARSYY